MIAIDKLSLIIAPVIVLCIVVGATIFIYSENDAEFGSSHTDRAGNKQHIDGHFDAPPVPSAPGSGNYYRSPPFTPTTPDYWSKKEKPVKQGAREVRPERAVYVVGTQSIPAKTRPPLTGKYATCSMTLEAIYGLDPSYPETYIILPTDDHGGGVYAWVDTSALSRTPMDKARCHQ